MPRDYDAERFRRLALYIASRSANDTTFGKTKLAKILFYSDFVAYTKLGDSITGATYSKFPRGPFPRVMGKELEQIQRCGAGVVARADYFGKPQERLVPLTEVDPNLFSAAEISIVEQVIEELRESDASSVSELSHLDPAWLYVDDMAPIPYELAWVSDAAPSEEVIRIGQEAAARLGLLNAAS
ncbi:MAG: Panacea domain-containing protein [Dehalococcoidia bacterium]